jgi:hypothetical protein
MGTDQRASARNDDIQKLQHIEIRSRSHYDVRRNICVTNHIITFSQPESWGVEEDCMRWLSIVTWGNTLIRMVIHNYCKQEAYFENMEWWQSGDHGSAKKEWNCMTKSTADKHGNCIRLACSSFLKYPLVPLPPSALYFGHSLQALFWTLSLPNLSLWISPTLFFTCLFVPQKYKKRQSRTTSSLWCLSFWL